MLPREPLEMLGAVSGAGGASARRPHLEQRILAFSLAHPGLGPKRIAAELAREKWGGLRISPNGVWRVLCRHGLNTRRRRLALVAGYAARYERPPLPLRPRHVEASRTGELLGLDCFSIGRLSGTVCVRTGAD